MAYAVRPRTPRPGTHDDRSLQDLWSDMSKEASVLLRKEVELAKIETKEQLGRAAKVGVTFSAAGMAGFFALQLLSLAAAWGLAAVLPTGVAFLIVGLVYGVVAAVLLVRAKSQASDVNMVPQQTVATLKEDVQWAQALRR